MIDMHARVDYIMCLLKVAIVRSMENKTWPGHKRIPPTLSPLQWKEYIVVHEYICLHWLYIAVASLFKLHFTGPLRAPAYSTLIIASIARLISAFCSEAIAYEDIELRVVCWVGSRIQKCLDLSSSSFSTNFQSN